MESEASAYAIDPAGRAEAVVLAEQVNELKRRAERCRRVASDCGSVNGARALERLADGIEAALDEVLARLSTLAH